MKQNLSPEVKTIAVKKAIMANLEKALVSAETTVSSIRYFEKTDMVRIRHEKGYSICISAEGKDPAALLYETIIELRPFLSKSVVEKTAYGDGSSFSLKRLSL